MNAPPVRAWIAAAGVLIACAACGFKGPLYLPERNGTVVTHPAQPSQGVPAPGRTQPPPGAKGKGKTAPAAIPPGPPAASPP